MGLGTMGGPMCRRLAAAGYAVSAYDSNADALATAKEAGASTASSALDCARRGELTLLHGRRLDPALGEVSRKE